MGTTLHTLKPNAGATRKKKRLGRGHGSGLRKTAGKGGKGQKARTGTTASRAGFEGGQMPMQRRLPEARLHQHRSASRSSRSNLGDLAERFDAGARSTIERAEGRKGLVPRARPSSSRSSATASSTRSSPSRRTSFSASREGEAREGRRQARSSRRESRALPPMKKAAAAPKE